MGRKTMVLNKHNPDDIPSEKGLYSIFVQENNIAEPLLCLTVSSAKNIRKKITSYLLKNEFINYLMLSGLSIFVIYEILPGTDDHKIFEKENEWISNYKPKDRIIKKNSVFI